METDVKTWLEALTWVRGLREADHDDAAKWLIANGPRLLPCHGTPPRRGKARFRQQGHDGSADVSWVGQAPPPRAQREKLLVRALWQLGSSGSLATLGPSGLLEAVLDYEVPLKPRGGEFPGVGKLDLLSRAQVKAPALGEVKIGSKSPLEGIVEVCLYAMVMKDAQNLAQLGEEYPQLDWKQPWKLMVLAPQEALDKNTRPTVALAQLCARSLQADFVFASLGPRKALRRVLRDVVDSCARDGRPRLSSTSVLTLATWP